MKGLSVILFVLSLALLGDAGESASLTPPIHSFDSAIAKNISSPVRIAVDVDGNILIADEDRKAVVALDPSGNPVFVIGGDDVPRSVAVDRQKRVIVGYMSDNRPSYAAMYDFSGRFLRDLGSGMGEFGMPADMAVSGTTGRIYVLDSVRNVVRVFNADGTAATDNDGNELRIGGFGSYDGYSSLSNPGRFDHPAGIAVDDIRQELLVSDQNNFRVQIFGFDGSFKTAFGRHAPDTSWSFGNPRYDLKGRFSSIRGLTVDREGRIYVADAFQGTVQVLDRSGNHLAFVGEQGAGDGQLSVPVDVVIDKAMRLIVADWNNNRLAVFQVDSGPAVNNQPPDSPVQVSPAHAAQLNTTTPTLTAYNANDPDGDLLNHRFEVDTSPSFTSPVSFAVAQGATYTSATVPHMADHTVYFWRVRAEEAATTEMLSSTWSSTRSFYPNAANRPPSAPSGLTPVASSVATRSTLLGWNTSVDPDLYDTVTYTVDVSEQADFSRPLLSKSGLTSTGLRIDAFSQYTLLKTNTAYYWRVTAIDNHGAASGDGTTGSFVFRQTLLQVSSTPQGAKVYLDGNYGYPGTYRGATGAVPLEIADIPPGRHVIRVEKAGYFGYYSSVQVAEGETRSVNAALTAAVGGTRPFAGNLAAGQGTVIGEGAPTIVSAKPFMVDWNNDGMKDLLVGDDGGRIYLFENTSLDAAPVFRLTQNYPGGIVLTAPARAAPFVADWNNDGVKDLLVGCGDGTVRLYLNTGADGAPSFGGFTNLAADGSIIQVNGNAVPVIVDWNDDLRKDLLVGDGSGKVALFTNTGADAAPAFNSTGQVAQGTYVRAGSADLTVLADAAPWAADWNLDGRKDLLVGSATGLSIFLNGGAEGAPSFTASTSGDVTGAGIAPLVLDYNNDGYPDLLAGTDSGHVGYYRFKADVPVASVAQAAPTPAKKTPKVSGARKLFKKIFKW